MNNRSSEHLEGVVKKWRVEKGFSFFVMGWRLCGRGEGRGLCGRGRGVSEMRGERIESDRGFERGDAWELRASVVEWVER
jgi:hypothetical protein